MKLSRIMFFLFLLGTLIPSARSDRRQTTRQHLHVRTEQAAGGADCWIRPDSGWQPVRFCGYEKKLSANKETIFIENLTDSAFSDVRFSITYLDSSNREIHRRTVEHPLDLPPRQTRRIDIRSWDTQNSYYYINGPSPRRPATPYRVAVSLDSLLIFSLTGQAH